MNTTTNTVTKANISAQNIGEVIVHLDKIIQWSIQHKSRIGYFAVVYKLMTEGVLKAIQQGAFQNNLRMEKLDVNFANRYISAWQAYTNKQPCSSAWCAAFDAVDNNQLIVLQHIILGINTHINLDLSIAAADTSPGDDIHNLQADFDKINDIIADLSEHVQEVLCRIWFPLRLINKLTRNREQAVINFSIRAARRAAWANAVALANATGQSRTNYINLVDNGVIVLSKKVISPGLYTKFLLKFIRMMEDRDVVKIMGILQSS